MEDFNETLEKQFTDSMAKYSYDISLMNMLCVKRWLLETRKSYEETDGNEVKIVVINDLIKDVEMKLEKFDENWKKSMGKKTWE